VAANLPLLFITFTNKQAIIVESRRQQKVAKLIQQELGMLIEREVSFHFGKAMLTVSEVKITPDLLVARVYISIYNADKAEEVFQNFKAHTSEIRYKLGKKIRHQLRRIPELQFYKDGSLDEVFRIEQILRESNKDKTEGPDQAEN